MAREAEIFFGFFSVLFLSRMKKESKNDNMPPFLPFQS